MMAEADDMMNGALAAEFAGELARLHLLKDRIEQHLGDTDYRIDFFCKFFPDMCSD